MKASRLFLTSCLMVFHSPLNGSENSGGEIVRGLPCVKRLNQLFCGSRGKSYPSTAIDKFIDDNKALLKRMYGELQEPRTVTTIRVVRTFKDSSSTRSSGGIDKSIIETFRHRNCLLELIGHIVGVYVICVHSWLNQLATFYSPIYRWHGLVLRFAKKGFSEL